MGGESHCKARCNALGVLGGHLDKFVSAFKSRRVRISYIIRCRISPMSD